MIQTRPKSQKLLFVEREKTNTVDIDEAIDELKTLGDTMRQMV